MLTSQMDALTRHDRATARGHPKARHEWPDVTLGLQAPGQRPQRLARLDDVGGRCRKLGLGYRGGRRWPSCLLGAGEGAGAEPGPGGGGRPGGGRGGGPAPPGAPPGAPATKAAAAWNRRAAAEG
ncbi:MAG: hypothetical protein WKF86_10975 [Acidimicrobiales bacterium]